MEVYSTGISILISEVLVKIAGHYCILKEDLKGDRGIMLVKWMLVFVFFP